MLSIELQARIFSDYHAGKEHTPGRKYLYTIQRNPLALTQTWIIRKLKKNGSPWEWVQPLDLQITLRNSKREV